MALVSAQAHQVARVECNLSRQDVEALVRKARARCTDEWDNSGKYTHVRDRWGSDMTMFELRVIAERLYCDDDDATITLVGPDGWTCKRHWSGQCGVGSVASRQKSLETVGLLLGLRESPDFVEEEKGVYSLLDWGTLLADAGKKAWEADVKKENRCIQLMASTVLKGCKRYARATPDDVLNFLIEYKNVVNGQVTEITIIQIWESTRNVELRFKQRAKQMGWGEMAWDKLLDLKYETAVSYYPGRWANPASYKVSSSFYRLSQLRIIDADWRGDHLEKAEQISVWDATVKVVNGECDLQRPAARKTETIFQSVNACFVVLKADYPELVSDCVRMVVPIPQDAKPLGQYKGLSPGLQNPGFKTQIREPMVRRLLQDMSNSEAFKQLADPDSKLHKDLKLKEAKAMLKATKAAAREKEKAEKKKKSEAAKAAASLVTKSGPRWRRQKGAAKEKSASRPASSLKAAAAT
ncbi:unnamed protein product, partial [Prorocentrum cordatum]